MTEKKFNSSRIFVVVLVVIILGMVGYFFWKAAKEGAEPLEVKPVYTITARCNDGGKIVPSGRVSVNRGQDIVFTFTPETGHEVKRLQVDGKTLPVAGSYEFKRVDADSDIFVEFQAIQHRVETVAGEGGSIRLPGPGLYNTGETVDIRIVPETGYRIQKVYLDEEEVNTHRITLPYIKQDHRVRATFEKIPTRERE